MWLELACRLHRGFAAISDRRHVALLLKDKREGIRDIPLVVNDKDPLMRLLLAVNDLLARRRLALITHGQYQNPG
jgi:hypothetical protein